jgi:excisionase family DNA binding protein
MPIRKGAKMFDRNALLSKPKLLRREAALLLGVTTRTVDRYMAKGKIEFVRMPGGRRKPLTESVKTYL